MENSYALAACTGMSPNGLIARVTCGDLRNENDNVISICMMSTAADIKGKNNKMLEKQPIIAVNGCKNQCVNKILNNKGIEVLKTVDVGEVLTSYNLSYNDPLRLDENGEDCVRVIKDEISSIIKI